MTPLLEPNNRRKHHFGGVIALLSLLGVVGLASAQSTTAFQDIPCGVFLDLPAPAGSSTPFLPFTVTLCGGEELNVTTRSYPLRAAPYTDEPYYTGTYSWALTAEWRLGSIDPAINPGDYYGRFQGSGPTGDLLLDFDVPIAAFGMSSVQVNGAPLTYADRMRLFDGPLGTGNLIAEVISEGPPSTQYHVALRFTGFDAGTPVIRSAVIDVQSNQDGIHLDGLAFGAASSPSASAEEPGLPNRRLHGPHPNPMFHSTSFVVDLAAESAVRLEVFDLAGRRVGTLVDEVRPAGRHTVTWDGRTDSGLRAPAGVYFARFLAGGVAETRRIHLVQ